MNRLPPETLDRLADALRTAGDDRDMAVEIDLVH